MSVSAVRAAIKAKVQALPGIGVVYDYERYVREESKFRELFVTPNAAGEDQLLGWWFRRSSTAERSVSVHRNVDSVTWTFRGFMAINDAAASELAFDALIESMRDAFRADPTLGGVAQQSPLADGSNVDGLQVVDVGPVLFCGVLCHSATLELTTWSYI